MEEEKYEAIELIVKSRPGIESWFDALFDYLTESCEGTDSDEDDCTCGLVHMGGCIGTYDQVMDWSNNIVAGISRLDVANAIKYLLEGYAGFVSDIPEDVTKVIDWADQEIAFENYYENEEWRNENVD